jgi:hypothetical protein
VRLPPLNHVPDKYEHLVRYYGYYANRAIGARLLAEQEHDTSASIVIERILKHLNVWHPSQPCIPRIESIDILNDRTLPFRMRSGKSGRPFQAFRTALKYFLSWQVRQRSRWPVDHHRFLLPFASPSWVCMSVCMCYSGRN